MAFLSASLASLGAAPKLDLLFATTPTHSAGAPALYNGPGRLVPVKPVTKVLPAYKTGRVQNIKNDVALVGFCDTAELCLRANIGDDFCDPDCMNEECNNDAFPGGLSDCELDATQGYIQRDGCPSDCERAWRRDSMCDPECNIEACNFDAPSHLEASIEGDCICGPESNVCCSDGCPLTWLSDRYKDPDCNNAVCNFDTSVDENGVFGVPDFPCDNDDCSYITTEAIPLCAEGCPEGYRGDLVNGLLGGSCDDECNVAACGYDTPREVMSASWYAASDEKWVHSDCMPDPGIPVVVNCDGTDESNPGLCTTTGSSRWILDDYCDPACDNDECRFITTDAGVLRHVKKDDPDYNLGLRDGGDCPRCNDDTDDNGDIIQGTGKCMTYMLNDQYCDFPCWNAECGWDKGTEGCGINNNKMMNVPEDTDCPSAYAPGCVTN